MRQINRMMELMFQVRSGLITVEQAISELKISRKTWYELENKALSAMYQSLVPGKPGRPKKQVDQEKEELKGQLKETQKQLMMAEHEIEIRKFLFGEIPDGVSSKKKN